MTEIKEGSFAYCPADDRVVYVEEIFYFQGMGHSATCIYLKDDAFGRPLFVEAPFFVSELVSFDDTDFSVGKKRELLRNF